MMLALVVVFSSTFQFISGQDQDSKIYIPCRKRPLFLRIYRCGYVGVSEILFVCKMTHTYDLYDNFPLKYTYYKTLIECNICYLATFAVCLIQSSNMGYKNAMFPATSCKKRVVAIVKTVYLHASRTVRLRLGNRHISGLS